MSEKNRVSVGTWPLPQGEGKVTVSLSAADAKGNWSELSAGTPYYFHKPNGCGGIADVVHVNDKKVVLHCRNCGVRIELVGALGLRPATVAEVQTVLNFMVRPQAQ